jgi:hypothetical protein
VQVWAWTRREKMQTVHRLDTDKRYNYLYPWQVTHHFLPNKQITWDCDLQYY